ncbi:MAG: hypothetical protein JWP17_670 [Solirubrobacterales bacterium]|nr:hypothetical protein [Solirubrobacterales bacterium]
MADRSPHANENDGARIGRRGFIGAGLAGAGVLLIGSASSATAGGSRRGS